MGELGALDAGAQANSVLMSLTDFLEDSMIRGMKKLLNDVFSCMTMIFVLNVLWPTIPGLTN